MSFIRAPSETYCPGIEDFVRPNVKYETCENCGGRVEIWSDESVGTCIDCGSSHEAESPTPSCLEYCAYADKCKGIIMHAQRDRNN